MCGIAGFLNHDPRKIGGREQVQRMCGRIAHRGPDGEGIFIGPGVALGHRRLSIIDIAGGSQPLTNEDGTLQVIFNGEIYNYLELRGELEKKGHQFHTRSDTEVLVHLYEEEGENMPEKLNGMFAFAIWDSKQNALFLARDRFGEKPLYYSTAVPELRFCFASELKALAILPGFPKRVAGRAITDFLSLNYIPDPDTAYTDVFKLPAAHSILVDASGLRIRRYWAPRFQCSESIRYEEAVEKTRALAEKAVVCRMMSDVPLGGFLSGGVDSSAVVAFMAGAAAADHVKTFSIGFTDRRYDELSYARYIAERYRTKHMEHVVTPSVQEMLETLVEHYDEPFGDASAIPTLYLARMTRQGVTVALSGDGADEIFAGYRRYAMAMFEESMRATLPGWFRRSVVSWGAEHYPKFDYLPRPFRAKSTMAGVATTLADSYYQAMSSFRDGGLQSVLSEDLRREISGYSPRESFRSRFERFRELPPLQQMQAVDLETYLPGQILVKVDRATMAYSLESRAPWLDPHLAEFACQMPASFKLRGRVGKRVFKESVAPLVGEVAVTRPKMGFVAPLKEWFRTSLRQTFEEAVLRKQMEAYLDLVEVRRIWAEHQSGLFDHQSKLWNLLMLACWDARHRN